MSNKVPERISRRDCASRVGEIFDLGGRFTPLVAGLKLDLSALCLRGLDWKDFIPSDLNDTWLENFKLIDQINKIQFKRVIVPDDAINLDFETLEMCDASQSMTCSALYARFKRNGSYSSQLLFARSKIVPKDTSMPRAELMAAVLCATTGHVVQRALGKFITHRVHLTDSQVVLYWLSNPNLPLKKWVRNRVIEINRLTDVNNWFYVDSKNNTADIGTRKGATISDVENDSRWVNGESWAKMDRKNFPIKSVKEIKLSKKDLEYHDQEVVKSEIIDNEWIRSQMGCSVNFSDGTTSSSGLNKVKERYLFSNYVIDPNRFRFRKVVRILSLQGVPEKTPPRRKDVISGI